MTIVHVLTVIDGYGSGTGTTTVHTTLADAEATLRSNYDQEPADYADLDLWQLRGALAARDGLNITLETVELPAKPDEPTVDDLLEPKSVAVWLNEIELGLLRAGLAAHNIALAHIDPRDHDKVARADEQRKAARELSIKLGEAQAGLA